MKKVLVSLVVLSFCLALAMPESQGGAVAGNCGGVATTSRCHSAVVTSGCHGAVANDCGGTVTNDCGGAVANDCGGQRVRRVRPTHVARTRTVSRRVGTTCQGQAVVAQKQVTTVRRAIVAQPLRTSLDVTRSVLGRCASVVGCNLNTVATSSCGTSCDVAASTCNDCVVAVPRRVVRKSLVVVENTKSCDSCNTCGGEQAQTPENVVPSTPEAVETPVAPEAPVAPASPEAAATN